MKLFVDTWGWIVLRNKREPMHTELSKFYFSWRNQRGASYTTDYILDETFTLLFRRLSFKEAKGSLDVIDLAIKEGYLRLERITEERFEKAKRLRIKFVTTQIPKNQYRRTSLCRNYLGRGGYCN